MQAIKENLAVWCPGSGCPFCDKSIKDESIKRHIESRFCKELKDYKKFPYETLQKISTHFTKTLKTKRKNEKIMSKSKIYTNKMKKTMSLLFKNKNNIETIGFQGTYSEEESRLVAHSIEGELGVGGKYLGRQFFQATIDGEPVLVSAVLLKKSEPGRKLLNKKYNKKEIKEHDMLTGMIGTVSKIKHLFKMMMMIKTIDVSF